MSLKVIRRVLSVVSIVIKSKVVLSNVITIIVAVSNKKLFSVCYALVLQARTCAIKLHTVETYKVKAVTFDTD